MNGQERPGSPRALLALRELVAGTSLEGASVVSTKPTDDAVFNERNLVVVTHLPVLAHRQLRNQLVNAPTYRRLTAKPPDGNAVEVGVERPILHVELDLGGGRRLHVINVHLKSKIPTPIPGQMIDNFTWRAADAWAEGVFISSMKRMGQALEVRRLVDQILDADPDARIVVAGDFNAPPTRFRCWPSAAPSRTPATPTWPAGSWYRSSRRIPQSARYTLFHQGRGEMLDHMLVTRNLLASLPRLGNPQRGAARRVGRIRRRP